MLQELDLGQLGYMEFTNDKGRIKMTRKFTVYLDSGANIHSTRKTTVTLAEIWNEEVQGSWNDADDNVKDEIMKEIAFERADWGYYEEVK